MPVDRFEICLGLDRNLRALKRRVPAAQTYADLGLDPYLANFAQRLLVEMNSAARIHFDVSEMVMINTPDGVLFGPVELNQRGSTNWELRTIWDHPALKTKTVFYLDGQIVSADKVLLIPG